MRSLREVNKQYSRRITVFDEAFEDYGDFERSLVGLVDDLQEE